MVNRTIKGTPLTHAELDANFTELATAAAAADTKATAADTKATAADTKATAAAAVAATADTKATAADTKATAATAVAATIIKNINDENIGLKLNNLEIYDDGKIISPNTTNDMINDNPKSLITKDYINIYNDFSKLNKVIDDPNYFGINQGDTFGEAIASHNGFTVVSAPNEDKDLDLNSGVVYIFDNSNNLIQTIENPNTSNKSDNIFGKSVGIYNNIVVVGAPGTGAPTGSDVSGAAYIYNIDGTLLHSLTYNTSITGYSEFGTDVFIHNDIIAVNTIGLNNFNSSLSIYNTSGVLLSTIEYPNSSGNDYGFKNGIALYNNIIAIGDPRKFQTIPDNSSDGGKSGIVYVYNINGTLLTTIENPNSFGHAQDDFFGGTISLYEDTLVISAPYEDALISSNPTGSSSSSSAGDSSGVVYVYNINGALLHTIENPDIPFKTGTQPDFGKNICINKNYIVISAPSTGAVITQNSGTSTSTYFDNSGKVYIYDLEGNLLDVIDDPNIYDVAQDDSFGRGLALTPEQLFVGAPNESSAGASVRAGVTYVFDLSPKSEFSEDLKSFVTNALDESKTKETSSSAPIFFESGLKNIDGYGNFYKIAEFDNTIVRNNMLLYYDITVFEQDYNSDGTTKVIKTFRGMISSKLNGPGDGEISSVGQFLSSGNMNGVNIVPTDVANGMELYFLENKNIAELYLKNNTDSTRPEAIFISGYTSVKNTTLIIRANV